MPKAKEPKVKVKEAAPAAVPPPADPSADAEATRARHQARADAFKALGDPIRLAICDYLAACAPHEQTAGAVCRAVTGDRKITAKVSHHLKELRRAGLIVMHKNGKNVLCGLDTGGAAALSAYLASWSEAGGTQTINHFVQGEDTDGNAAPALINNQISDAQNARLVAA